MEYTIPLCAFLLLAQLTAVAGWNQLCREAIESTAMSAITYMRLRRLKVLLRGDDLVDYTWWADEVLKRIPESQPLHYQPQPDRSKQEYSFTCESNLCLLPGIKHFFAQLMNAGFQVRESDAPKLEIPPLNYPKQLRFSPSDCIKYLVVLISDLHHPLHLDYLPPDGLATIPVDLSAFPVWEEISMKALNTKKPFFADFLDHVYMPKYIEVNEDAWYGSWTHVSTLGLRYSTELEMFNKKTVDCFELWAAETVALNNALLEASEFVEADHMGHHRAIKFNEKLDAKLGFLMRLQIVIAGARIAIAINYVLSHRDISYDARTGLIIERDQRDPPFLTVLYYMLIGIFVILALVGDAHAQMILTLLFFAIRGIVRHMRKKREARRAARGGRYLPVNKLPE